MAQQIGRYEIIQELGQGGMATVYLAFDSLMQRQVAVKVLSRQFTSDPRFLERFEREARTIAALEDAAIVPVYDFGVDDGWPYLVMRAMFGGTLIDRIERGRGMALTEASRVLNRLAPALDKAHANGIIHRDLKPDNVLFDEEERPYLADFGIAQLADATQTVTLLCTPAYMSPEQAEGKLKLDWRNDIYALGVMLFEMLTGRPPYEAETAVGQMLMHILEPVPDVLEANPDLPATIQAVIERGMAKDREERFQTAVALARAVQQLLTTPPVASMPVTPPAPLVGETAELAASEEVIQPKAAVETPLETPLEEQPTAESFIPAAEEKMPQPAPSPLMVKGKGPLKRVILPAWAWWVAGIAAAIIIVMAIQVIFSTITDRISQTVARDSPTEAAVAAEDEPAPAKAPSKEMEMLEVVSLWPSSPSYMEPLIAEFREKYPYTEVIHNHFPGDYPDSMGALATRLQTGHAPDSFQGHAGQEIISAYVVDGQLEPLNFLYEENGWLDVMREELIQHISSKDGHIYSVPVNIHRSNLLWANPDVLAESGLEMPTNLGEWLATMDELRDLGMDAPLSLGQHWTALHLFETVLLASLGPDAYNALWDGRGDWASPAVTQAIEDFQRILSYANSDASEIDWLEAGQRVVQGDAAFNVMGDWQESYFRDLGYVPGEDYIWAPVPGTAGNYQFISDSFVLPVGAAHRDATIAWLTVVGSRGGQDAFNPLKGSIPARSDGNRSLYGEYQQSAMEDWANDTVAGSLVHGVVANNEWKADIDEALGRFLFSGNTAEFQRSLAAACDKVGACQ